MMSRKLVAAGCLEKLSINYTIVSRKKGTENSIGYEQVDENVLSSNQIIVNTTPLGMYPNEDHCPSLPYHALTPEHYLFDLVYNPPKSKFLQQGEKQGARIINGYQMLAGQAEESWRIWNEREVS